MSPRQISPLPLHPNRRRLRPPGRHRHRIPSLKPEPNAIPEHRALALSLIQYGTFYFRDFNYFGPSSVQSPPYPMLLATLFKIFGPDSNHAYLAAMVINSLAGAITVWFTYLFVQSIGSTPKTSLIAAGALVTFWPSQIPIQPGTSKPSPIITCALHESRLFYFFQHATSPPPTSPLGSATASSAASRHSTCSVLLPRSSPSTAC